MKRISIIFFAALACMALCLATAACKLNGKTSTAETDVSASTTSETYSSDGSGSDYPTSDSVTASDSASDAEQGSGSQTEPEPTLAPAADVINLSGEMFDDDGIYVSGNNTASIVTGKSLMKGRFTVRIKGYDRHGVYFCLSDTGFERGRPTGSYYSLYFDVSNNLVLERCVDDARSTVGASILLKQDYSPEIFYTLTVEVYDEAVRVFHGTVPVITYVHETLPLGNKVAFFAENEGCGFFFEEFDATPSAAINGSTLIWSFAEDAQNLTLSVGDEEIALNGASGVMDLSSLELPAGVYELTLNEKTNEETTLLQTLKYVVEREADDIDVYSGSFAMWGENYHTKQSKSLALLSGVELTNGSISGSVTPNTANDCGILFRASSGGRESFWEEAGASYYVALVNYQGLFLLGKVNDGTWTSLKQLTISGFALDTPVEIKINLNDATINVTVNETQTLEYVDASALYGGGVGFRAFNGGVDFSPITLTAPKPERLELVAPSAIEKGGELKFNAYVAYDNGMRELIDEQALTVKPFDKDSTGEKTLEVSTEVNYLGKALTLNASKKVAVCEELYYAADFNYIDQTTKLPAGWVHTHENNANIGTVTADTEGIKVANGSNYNVHALYYRGDFDKADYTVEADLTLHATFNDGRWFGPTVRASEEYGYVRAYRVVNGRTGGGVQSRYDLSTGVATNSAAFQNAANVQALELNSSTHFKVTVSGSKIVLVVDGVETYRGNLSSNYLNGFFGFTCGGGDFTITSYYVRGVTEDDYVPTPDKLFFDMPSALEKGSKIPEVFVSYDNGKTLPVSDEFVTVTGYDANAVGKQNVKVEVNYTLAGVTLSLNKTYEVYVVENLYYATDFNRIDSTTNLPENWVHVHEKAATGTIVADENGFNITNGNNYAVNTLYYTGSFNHDDYTIELDVELVATPNTGRWFGPVVRVTEQYGYARIHRQVGGKTTGTYQTKYDFNGSSVANTGSFTGTTTVPELAVGETTHMRATVSGNKLVFAVDGTVTYVGTLTENYLTGKFGFTCGGGNYIIKSYFVRAVADADIPSA